MITHSILTAAVAALLLIVGRSDGLVASDDPEAIGAAPHTAVVPTSNTPLSRYFGLRERSEFAAAGDAIVCSTYPCPAGYFWYYFTDPECPENPDTFNAYIEYWNEDESFYGDAYAGHASYTCDEVYKPTTVYSSGVYQNCLNNSPWNCQDLGWTWDPHP